MRVFTSIWLLAVASLTSAAQWSYQDGTVAVRGKGVGAEAVKESLSANKPVGRAITLSTSHSLKVVLTATNSGQARKPDQAFLTLSDPLRGLDESFPMQLKESGKATVDVKHEAIPISLLTSSNPLTATIVLASFGSSKPHTSTAFTLTIDFDPSQPRPQVESPLRYGKLPSINHVFRADPKNPPRIITLVFLAAAATTVPALFIVWASLGANVNHLSKAMGSAPLAHAAFFGSILAMEGVFFMYYTTWNLFQTLPAAGVVGAMAFVSGTKALTEVQERRLAGLR